MKKFIAIVLLLVLVLSCCACKKEEAGKTAAPTQPSIFTRKKWPMSMLTRTMAVETVSERLSVAVASMAAEFIFLPTARL